MGQTAVLCEVRWPYTSNLAYVESDEDVGPCHVGCGCMCMRGIVFGWYYYNTRMRYAWALRLVSDS
jgi:hypothetical protein